MSATTRTTTRATDPRVIAFVEGYGLRPRPHSFNSKIVNWKIVPAPNPNLVAWQEFVKKEAKKVIGDIYPYDAGLVWAEIVLIERTPYGKKHGDTWGQNVRWDRVEKVSVREGLSVADFDNTIKSTLDAIKGVVIADDIQVRCLDKSRMIYGPEAGFRITIRSWE
jgi:hypothetical protein